MGKGDRVLLVDDSAAARSQLRDALLAGGFQVSEASEGSEALFRARQQAFDLVMTDVHMPTMDGPTFIRELRKLSGYEGVPVLVLTSDFSRQRIQQVREAGATAWLEKPPNLATVARLLRETINAHRTSSSADRR